MKLNKNQIEEFRKMLTALGFKKYYEAVGIQLWKASVIGPDGRSFLKEVRIEVDLENYIIKTC